MDYYLGIDIGTTATKAIAFSEKGIIIQQYSFHYKMDHPEKDRSEQDPNEILQAVINGINKIVSTLSPARPLFVSFSSAMHSLIVLGENGDLLTPCIIWADNRADKIASALKVSNNGKSFYKATGVPIHPMSPLCKILWFRQHEPEIFEKASKFIGIKEYVFYKLFNLFVVDSSVASATGLLNLKTLEWDKEILNYLEIGDSKLSKVVSASYVLTYKNLHPKVKLDNEIPFVIGASDGALSNLGVGAEGGNTLAMTIGTSGAARMLLPYIELDDKMRTFCYHVYDKQYIIGGASNNGAVVLQWLKETLLKTNESLEALLKQAEAVLPGSEGLIFLPYILGERAPIWNPEASGVYFGLNVDHTKAHLIRASLEGIVLGMYSIGKILAEKRKIETIHAAGGFAKSDFGLQILADVFNCEVYISGAVESSALGAIKLGAGALNLPNNFNTDPLKKYLPDAANNKVYMKKFLKFERLYQLLKDEMSANVE